MTLLLVETGIDAVYLLPNDGKFPPKVDRVAALVLEGGDDCQHTLYESASLRADSSTHFSKNIWHLIAEHDLRSAWSRTGTQIAQMA